MKAFIYIAIPNTSMKQYACNVSKSQIITMQCELSHHGAK